jgi:hypothetical protein
MPKETSHNPRKYRTLLSPGRDIHEALEKVAQRNHTTRQELLERAAKGLIECHEAALKENPSAKETIPPRINIWRGANSVPEGDFETLSQRVAMRVYEIQTGQLNDPSPDAKAPITPPSADLAKVETKVLQAELRRRQYPQGRKADSSGT